MKGKSWKAENRELAFRTYCEEGGNVEGTLRRLEKQHGLKLSKPTFYEWMEKYRFKERFRTVDAERQQTQDSRISFEERMLNDLVKQKTKYEQYFDQNGALDHQATYAYTNICKVIVELSRKLKPKKEMKDPEELRRLADEVLETEYGIQRA